MVCQLTVRSAHMGHVGEDVVDYWNRRGKFFGEKSSEVRSWMRDSNSYRLEKGAGKGRIAPTAHKIEVDMIGINQLDLDGNLIIVMIDIENLHLISFNFIEEL